MQVPFKSTKDCVFHVFADSIQCHVLATYTVGTGIPLMLGKGWGQGFDVAAIFTQTTPIQSTVSFILDRRIKQLIILVCEPFCGNFTM